MANFNVMDTVYISTNGIVVECILQQKNIFDGRFLVKDKNSTNQYIVDPDGIFKDYKACEDDMIERRDAEFADFADQFNSLEAIIAHFMYKNLKDVNHNPIEIAAAISKASEYLKVDMWSYINEFAREQEEIANEQLENEIEI